MASNVIGHFARLLATLLVVLGAAWHNAAKESFHPAIGGVACDTPGLFMTPCIGGANCKNKYNKCKAPQQGLNDQICQPGQGGQGCFAPACMPMNNDIAPNTCTKS